MSEGYPRHWEVVTLGVELGLINGRAFKPVEWSRSGVPIIRIQNLNNPDAAYNYYEGDLPEKFRVIKGDLLFAWSGTPGTSFGAHIWNGQNAWLNQHIFRVVFSEDRFDRRFLQFAINQNLREYVRAAHGGAGLAHITKGKFESSTLPRPSLAEQRRIVAKVEALFSELEAGVAALKQARAQLAVYRQALLRDAFEGRLTAHWRSKHANSSKWKWQSLSAVADVSGGLTKNPKREQLRRKMKYLRVANVHAGRLDLAEVKEIGVTDDEAERLKLVQGDLLVVEGNGSIDQIGRVAEWSGLIPDCAHQNHLIRARVHDGMLPRFILLYLSSPLGRDVIVKAASSTSGLHTLSISKVSGLQVPVADVDEQKELLNQLEPQLDAITALETDIDVNLGKAEALRQAILKKAFAGELVPQALADEPAAALLARIAAERKAKAVPPPRQRRVPTRHA